MSGVLRVWATVNGTLYANRFDLSQISYHAALSSWTEQFESLGLESDDGIHSEVL